MTEYTPEKVAELVAELLNEKWEAEALARQVHWRLYKKAADALTVVSAERDAEYRRAEGFRQAFLDTSKDRFRIKAKSDRLHKAITEALESLDPSTGTGGAMDDARRILRAALDTKGQD